MRLYCTFNQHWGPINRSSRWGFHFWTKLCKKETGWGSSANFLWKVHSWRYTRSYVIFKNKTSFFKLLFENQCISGLIWSTLSTYSSPLLASVRDPFQLVAFCKKKRIGIWLGFMSLATHWSILSLALYLSSMVMDAAFWHLHRYVFLARFFDTHIRLVHAFVYERWVP